MQKMQQKPKNIFNRHVRCQEIKIISIRLEIRNQHVEMHQIPSMEEKSATSSAKLVSRQGGGGGESHVYLGSYWSQIKTERSVRKLVKNDYEAISVKLCDLQGTKKQNVEFFAIVEQRFGKNASENPP